MKKLIFCAVISAFAGCSDPNSYKCWFPSLTIEEQMNVVKKLEENGWENIGISTCDGSTLFTATRKAKQEGGAK